MRRARLGCSAGGIRRVWLGGVRPTSGIPPSTPPTRTVAAMDKPEVTIPDQDPPADLVLDDLEAGTGPEAVPGKRVAVHYVGVAWSDGAEFDNSYDRGEPLVFPLGAGQVIQGWDRGIAGMKVGGRRRITIPPHLGYGARGAGGVIKPDETLVFVCDLVGVA